MIFSEELLKILNDPGMTWKVRRALLVHKLGMSVEESAALVPKPIEELDFDPSDY